MCLCTYLKRLANIPSNKWCLISFIFKFGDSMDFIIKKDCLNKYNSVNLHLENIECFNIPIEYVLDIYALIEKEDDEYNAIEGYLLLSSKASKLVSDMYDKGKKNLYYLSNRIPKYLDICRLTLKGEDELSFSVLYDPVLDVDYSPFEFSNCCSYEINEDGNILIKFGKLSNCPIVERKPSSYYIDGWKDRFIFQEYIIILDNSDYKLIKKDELLLNTMYKEEKISILFKGISKFKKYMDGAECLEIYQLVDESFFVVLEDEISFKCKSIILK